jgi:hypothetical protein
MPGIFWGRRLITALADRDAAYLRSGIMDLAIRTKQSFFPGLGTEHRHLAHDPQRSHDQQIQLLDFHPYPEFGIRVVIPKF